MANDFSEWILQSSFLRYKHMNQVDANKMPYGIILIYME